MAEIKQILLNDKAFFDYMKEEIKKTGWIKAGYDEQGQLIQFNIKTKKYRVLDKWVEIRKND